jgi:beta-propeller repeat-containing protein
VPAENRTHPLETSRLQNMAMVAKLDPEGAAFVYATFLGGPGDDHAFAVAVDDLGQAYVVGNTFSPDFLGNPAVKLAGGYDAFIAKLDVTGSTLLYGTYVGSPGSDGGFGIALDRQDNAYITGNTDSRVFPLTSGSPQPQLSGGQDAFVARIVIPAQPLSALDPVSAPDGASTTVRYFSATHTIPCVGPSWPSTPATTAVWSSACR